MVHVCLAFYILPILLTTILLFNQQDTLIWVETTSKDPSLPTLVNWRNSEFYFCLKTDWLVRSQPNSRTWKSLVRTDTIIFIDWEWWLLLSFDLLSVRYPAMHAEYFLTTPPPCPLPSKQIIEQKNWICRVTILSDQSQTTLAILMNLVSTHRRRGVRPHTNLLYKCVHLPSNLFFFPSSLSSL